MNGVVATAMAHRGHTGSNYPVKASIGLEEPPFRARIFLCQDSVTNEAAVVTTEDRRALSTMGIGVLYEAYLLALLGLLEIFGIAHIVPALYYGMAHQKKPDPNHS